MDLILVKSNNYSTHFLYFLLLVWLFRIRPVFLSGVWTPLLFLIPLVVTVKRKPWRFSCRSAVSHLNLPITVCSLAKWRKSKTKLSTLHKSSIEKLNLKLALNPPFCQTAVMHSAVSDFVRKF